MKGLGRNFIYWGSTMEKLFLYMLAAVCAFTLFFSFINNKNILDTFLNYMPGYLVMINTIIVFVNALNNITIYLPLSVTLGSTRKMSFTAMQIVQHLIQLQAFILTMIISYCSNRQSFEKISLYTIIGAFLLLIGMGNIISIVNLTKGRTLAIATYMIFIFLTVGGYSFVTALFYSDNVVLHLPGILYGPIPLICGILFDFVTIFISYRIFKKCNLNLS